jgi:hypothetical protein
MKSSNILPSLLLTGAIITSGAADRAQTNSVSTFLISAASNIQLNWLK